MILVGEGVGEFDGSGVLSGITGGGVSNSSNTASANTTNIRINELFFYRNKISNEFVKSKDRLSLFNNIFKILGTMAI